MADLKIMEAACPNCGSADVNLSHSGNPLTEGVMCWDCGTVYKLDAAQGRVVGVMPIEDENGGKPDAPM